MPVITFRAAPELAMQIREAANQDERTRSAFLRRLVAEALKGMKGRG